ncbi:NAD(P)-dependent oxidoreductase [Thalassobaculum sp. OXR-137]|uniref:NAD-dependent epimerase/dehydratase family protein n=1 Tax=Thalassobaculum sp. OXR-137 TaxID=3100173 RepID=UPI002AC9DC07|nr:NAD(P)-dependent oxidoreductase [Thalassobaculum sp. OXR-137]WPZ32439.1 NAD(P)-dependent oxidoreductase [Thalassobaculum sp. OXR-137]
MRILVTGSSGHLGEALMRVLAGGPHEAVGIDIKPGPFTQIVGSVADPDVVAGTTQSVDAVLHTATLHKPHVGTHRRQAFVDANITGTLTLLEEAVRCGVSAFVFTSTTSAFGGALTPEPGQPAAWIDESVRGTPKNIYGVTKTAAEDLCELFHRRHGLPCLILRTSRFFPEEDDNRKRRTLYADANAKANEFLFRRVDLADAAEAHLCALDRAAEIGFGRYIVSATTAFTRADLPALRRDPGAVVGRLFPNFEEIYGRLGYRMFDEIDRVYDNAKARRELGWRPEYDFARVLDQLSRGEPIGSPLARAVGSKGYHDTVFADGPYPVE